MVYNWDSATTRALINIVQRNPSLYAKSCKVYKNQQQKNLAWTEVGKTLRPPCPGEEAARKFKSLRDIFSKERRKIMNTEPRSGAGATTEYKSQWEFYLDLLFLVDHIEPRKTYSNMSKSCMQSLAQTECDEKKKNEIFIVPELSTTTVQNDIMTSVLQKFPVNVDMVSEAVNSINTYDILSESPSDIIIEELTDCSMTSDTVSDSSSYIRKKVKHQKKVPPSDIMHKKKKTEPLDSITNNISAFANIASSCMSELNQKKENETDTFKVALQNTPEDSKISFIIDVLRISEIYRKGKKPLITEVEIL